MPSTRRGLLIGAGYFSQFHLDAWSRLDGASIECVCDLDEEKAAQTASKFGVPDFTSDLDQALSRNDIDFIDVATGPTGRVELIQRVLRCHLPVICQKPLANTFEEATQIVSAAESNDSPFMVHENFRFQPWYREIKSILDSGLIGSRLQKIHIRTRMGDGWPKDAYLSRQPYFRTMPRLLIHETGVHFLDTFRYLAGEITSVCASLQRLNDGIVGEDAGVVTAQFSSGAVATWDADRYHESCVDDPRYTFGEVLVEADGGSIWLDTNGEITIKKLGQPTQVHDYQHERRGFAGDCVYFCQKHFLDVLDGKVACETSPGEYIKTLRAVEAAYKSNEIGRVVSLMPDSVQVKEIKRRIVDLSLAVNGEMRGVEIRTARTRENDGWNATTLELYSHAGTHMDAPRHFIDEAATLDAQDLSVCIGSARVVDLSPAYPSQLITVSDFEAAAGNVAPGDRVLIRTDWHKRYGTSEYRDGLPRISLELAQWLVEKGVALIGVEPPSVADVNNAKELTDVHQTLFRGNVVIIEGLANLDQLSQPEVEFIALPLKIVGGDGCPVRAIAIENLESD